MPALNRALLMGWVATRPAVRPDGSVRVVLGIERDLGRAVVDRCTVAAHGQLAGVALKLEVGGQAVVEGRVIADDERAGAGLVEASRMFVLAGAPAPASPPVDGGGTHAPPRAHERRGHRRVLHRGSVDERVVWVRRTRVGGGADPARAR